MTMNLTNKIASRTESDVRFALLRSDTVPAEAAAHSQTKGIRL